MEKPQEPTKQVLSNFIKYGKGIDKGFGALLIFFVVIAGLVSNLTIPPTTKALSLILICILTVLAFNIYAKNKKKSTIVTESTEDLKEGRITKKTYEKIVEET